MKRNEEPYTEEESIPEHDRTSRDHAGEAIKDVRNWPGYVCMGLALGALGMTLTAAAYGFAGWMWIGSVAVLVFAAAGLAIVLIERKRVKSAEGRDLTDQSGH